MLLKMDSIKEYTDDDGLKAFCEQTWGEYIRSLDDTVISSLISIQSHGMTEGSWFDDKIIKLYLEELPKFPPVPFDIIVYRGGYMKITGRPILSASFYEETALKKFANNKKRKLHTIVLQKGSQCHPYIYGNLEVFQSKRLLWMFHVCIEKLDTIILLIVENILDVGYRSSQVVSFVFYVYFYYSTYNSVKNFISRYQNCKFRQITTLPDFVWYNNHSESGKIDQ